jgi:hypothetical protein
MKLRVDQLDMQKTRQHWPADRPFAPALVKPVADIGGSRWTVLSSPFVPGEKPDWAYSEHDEYLRIPLFSYDLNKSADLALAFMLQMGLSCAGHLPARQIAQFYVVTGTPVELLYDSDTDINVGIRYWVGFALMLN